MSDPQAVVIEDDVELLVIFSQALRSAGFAVETASTAAEAYQRLAAGTPHVMTLDLHLQQTKGDEILHHIRTEPRFSKTYVILTTADSAMADALQDQAD